jgi:hypothetical protein
MRSLCVDITVVHAAGWCVVLRLCAIDNVYVCVCVQVCARCSDHRVRLANIGKQVSDVSVHVRRTLTL